MPFNANWSGRLLLPCPAIEQPCMPEDSKSRQYWNRKKYANNPCHFSTGKYAEQNGKRVKLQRCSHNARRSDIVLEASPHQQESQEPPEMSVTREQGHS